VRHTNYNFNDDLLNKKTRLDNALVFLWFT